MSERHSELRVLRWADRIDSILEGQMRGPIRANLDLDNRCSHKCAWCEPAEYRADTIRDGRFSLSLPVIMETLSDLHDLDCKAIQFSGGGEPTLNPEFANALWRAKKYGFTTFVVTHGGFIDKWMNAFVENTDIVRVSLDASCEREHMEMHGTKAGEFDRVIENVRALVKARGKAKTPEIGLAYIVADCNSGSRSIWDFMHLAQDLGVDFVQFRPLSEPEPKRLTIGWKRAVIQIEEMPHDVAAWPFRVEILGQRQHDVFLQREFKKCYAALTVATIGANGDVSACCDRRDLVFGNINEQSFKDIWLSAKHREMAASIVPQLCSRCVLCGYNRSVQKFVVENQAVPELI